VNLDLTIERGPSEEVCRAVVRCGLWSAVARSQAIALPPLIAACERFRPAGADPGRDVHHLAPLDARSFGTQLFVALFADESEPRRLWRQSFERVRAERRHLRVRLILRDVPALEALPWEYLFDPAECEFVALQSNVTLVRVPESPLLFDPPPVVRPLRILAILATPKDVPALATEQEQQAIGLAWRGLQGAGSVAVEHQDQATWEATWNRLEARPDATPCHVLHFAGHGRFTGTAQAGELAFEDAAGAARWIDGDSLRRAFATHPTLRLLVLNACFTARGSATASGLAQGLAYAQLPAVIAMQFAIRDAAAVEFAAHLYSSLAAGNDVDVAMTAARRRLSTTHRDDWASPVLFLRARDGALWHFPPGPPRSARLHFPRFFSRSAPGAATPWWRRAPARIAGGAIAVGVALLAGLARAHHGQPTAQPPPPSIQAGAPQEAGAANRGGGGGGGGAVGEASPECRLPAAVERLFAVAPRFRRVGPARFRMGTDRGALGSQVPLHVATNGEMPSHEVEVAAFCMQTGEVTQDEWQAVMPERRNPSTSHGGALPVDSVSWFDAEDFVARLNTVAGAALFRLPDEAEWELAARAGNPGLYSFGDDAALLPEYGNCRGTPHPGFRHTLPAGSLKPNAFGLYDLHGNVAEWVADAPAARHAPAGAASSSNGGGGTTAALHVLRGGSWDNDPARCRSASRDLAQPGYATSRVGFRLALRPSSPP
jgi:formylglycine-generating enzyme required for sulfatase activity